MRSVDSRFRIINLIEHNIFCEKYLVEDIESISEGILDGFDVNKRYIMNIFKGEFLNSELFDLFLHKSIYYKNIIHKNIVEYKGFYIAKTIDEELMENNVYYSLEEYIDRESVINYLDLKEEEKTKVVEGLLHALSYLHFRGEVYKYINFNNVVIYREHGMVVTKIKNIPSVLFDNFAYSNNLKNFTQFVAPEVIYENKKSLNSDIFSLGVFLYYLLSSKDFIKYRYKEDLKDEFEENLREVLKKMTNYIESDRYESVLEVCNELATVLGVDIRFDDKEYYRRLMFDNLLISRKYETEEIVRFVKSNISHKTNKKLMLISGEPGVGKTRLVKEVNYLLGMDRIETYHIECIKGDTDGYDNVVNLLKILIGNKKVDRKLIERYGNEIVKIIPEFREFWDVSAADVLKKDREQLKINNRVSNFIGEFVDYSQVVFIIDNIQNLSRNEQYIVDYMLNMRSDSNITIVGTYDSTEIDMTSYINDLMKHGEYEHIHINNFNYDEAGDLIKNILGIGYLPMNLITTIMNETKGNPRFIEEMIKNLFLKGELFISDYRMWHFNKSDIRKKDSESLNDTLINMVSSLDKEDKNIIQTIAVFNSPVEKELLTQLFTCCEEDLTKRIRKLVEINILSEKMGDYGFNYDFHYLMLREIIVGKMALEDRSILHSTISDILEKYIMKYNSKSYFDILIFHLIQSNNYKKAIHYSVEYGRHMRTLKVFSQSREYYQKALNLLRYERDLPLIVEILFEIADIFIRQGEIEAAYVNLIEAKNIDFEDKDIEKHMLICKTLIELYLNKKELIDAKEVLNEGIRCSVSNRYTQGVLEMMKLYYEYFKSKGDNHRCGRIIESGLKMSSEYEYYNYCFKLKKWEYDYNINGIEYNTNEYMDIYDYFCENNYIVEWSETLLKLAVQDLKHSRIYEARVKINEAITKLDIGNVQKFRENLFIVLGETYVRENKINEGIEVFSKSIDIAELNGNRDALFHLYLKLSKNYLEFDQYNKANVYLKKAQLEYEFSMDRGFLVKDYYIIHINYYIENYDIKNAEIWFEKFLEIIDGVEALYEDIIDMYLFKYEAIRYGKINEDIVDKLKKFNYFNYNIRDFRMFLLNASYYAYMYKKIEIGRSILEIDDTFSKVYDDGYFTKFKNNIYRLYSGEIKELKRALASIPKNINLKRLHSVYYAIGDIYYEMGDKYNSLINYFESLEILKVIYYSLPDDMKEVFICNDILKLRFREKFFEIIKLVTGQEFELDNNPKNFQNFIQFDYLVDLVENKNFVQSAYNVLVENRDWFDISFIIENMKRDIISNMKYILSYLLKMTMSDKGYIFYLDNDNVIKDYITEKVINDDAEIKELLKSQNNLVNGIMINRFIDINKSISDKSSMLVPITIDNEYEKDRRKTKTEKEILGYLYLESDCSINNFTVNSLEACKRISKILYVLIVNYNLKKMSTVDKLTGVYLRKYFEEMFRKKLKQSHAKEEVFSIVMVDIDDFKYINDTYGHRRGDKVLSKLGNVFNSNLRGNDIVGRYGGEEFIILLSNVDAHKAYSICEKLRKKIVQEKLMGDKEKLTVSFGISSFPKDGKNINSLVEKADQALYESKENGKNQVTIWNREINDTRKRYDKLAGIFTGNISRDARVIQSIMNIVSYLESKTDKEDAINGAISEVIDITDGKCGTIIEIKGGRRGKKYCKNRNSNSLKEEEMNLKLINHILTKKISNYFIDWNNSEFDKNTGLHQWNSYVSVPLEKAGDVVGYIILSVPITEKEFDYNDYNIVKSIAPILSSLL